MQFWKRVLKKNGESTLLLPFLKRIYALIIVGNKRYYSIIADIYLFSSFNHTSFRVWGNICILQILNCRVLNLAISKLRNTYFG